MTNTPDSYILHITPDLHVLLTSFTRCENNFIAVNQGATNSNMQQLTSLPVEG